MMNRVMAAMAFVIVITLIGGGLGGLVGREVGRFSPEFASTIAFGKPSDATPGFRADRFGMGLGIVSGLFFGVGSSLVVVVVVAMRDVWIARAGGKSRD